MSSSRATAAHHSCRSPSPRAGSKPTDVIYKTASGARPVVRIEVKSPDPKTGLVEFSIKVDRATIPVGSALCVGSPATTNLRTAFGLQVGAGAPLVLDVTPRWRCLGTQSKTP